MTKVLNTNIKIGDIFIGGWNYPFFYEVVAKRGKQTICLRKIDRERIGIKYGENGYVYNEVQYMPVKGKYIGNEIKVKKLASWSPNLPTVENIELSENAYLWDGQPGIHEYSYAD